VLRGLGDQLQDALAARGLRVRTYCPVGDLVAGMAYLVRRLLENTSNESFLHERASGAPLEELLAAPKEESGAAGDDTVGEGEAAEEVDDDLYQDAVRVVCEMGRASTSTLQRRLRIGYGRAARLIDLMEKDGIVGPPDGTKPREVLKNRNWMKEFDDTQA